MRLFHNLIKTSISCFVLFFTGEGGGKGRKILESTCDSKNAFFYNDETCPICITSEGSNGGSVEPGSI